ncbi:MAG: indoleacetamide hydrolase [Deltaproteobacteria bacterium]|nr:indoleacetamide hydrolase [Deltaproteobacteria bacterium]
MAYCDFTITEAVSRLTRGQMSTLDYIRDLLERCERYRDLNALISQDQEMLLDAARRADRARSSGNDLGSLHRIPIILKDNIDTADLPTTGGTPAFINHRPSKNAPVAQALIDAGAIIFAKANLHELAHGITNNNAAFGPARNPYAPDRIPGGSSGGCGVAVAARLAPGAIGTDTGGSVRIPSALCGIVGFRPSLGRYPQAGIIPISHTRDTAGPMTRSVKDAVLLDRVITGDTSEIEPANLHGLRLGDPRSPFYENIHTAVADAMESVLERLRAYGVELVEMGLPDVHEIDQDAGFPIALYEMLGDLNQYMAYHKTGLDFSHVVDEVASPDVRAVLEKLLTDDGISTEAYQKAMTKDRPILEAAYRNYFATNRVSAIVFPTTPLPAVPIGEDETTTLNGETVPTFLTFIRNTSPGSLGGIPGLSLPVGISPDGLPIGMELDAPLNNDGKLLAIGLALEALEPPLPAPNLSL